MVAELTQEEIILVGLRATGISVSELQKFDISTVDDLGIVQGDTLKIGEIDVDNSSEKQRLVNLLLKSIESSQLARFDIPSGKVPRIRFRDGAIRVGGLAQRAEFIEELVVIHHQFVQSFALTVGLLGPYRRRLSRCWKRFRWPVRRERRFALTSPLYRASSDVSR
ncbi:hypothetical protein [Salinigranum rubrum]|uniref:hypothetical protein n=1 Tax=Salinigranum rubrum TaxID=755307 RepID=UPI0013A5682A|nr:hypothetical protein [Salinigranum rubrum]